MQINQENLDLLFKGYQTNFHDAFKATEVHYNDVSMTVGSRTSKNVFGWLGQFPGMREWVGDRIIQELNAHGFTIENRKFESTVAVKRDDISDDQYGIYAPLFSEMGRTAKVHPDELVFNLLQKGFATKCYDGQNFFDPDHPIYNKRGETVATTSNMQNGDGPAWFLIDTTRKIKPIIWQEREAYELQSVTEANSEHVFMKDEYLYGIRARANAGFGLWQLAFGSKATLSVENYKQARVSMTNLKGDRERLLGVKPALLVVPPALEEDALKLLKADQIEGSSNIWRDTAELLVSPYLAETE
ncbi:Mu-like prophage major head subunit gpT family protein [Pseudovibrio sp. POLY-S9]|uniref:Mu-like prophage major head subunit gpT family protein n=1 Tax=Pseudovibrio sp. POLY-S9 TaxID=1576596 RepID=UPI00070A3C26|nr:Mu-like prophage major head subunit gpT family protein [Pseudovibrio sp. POLY-S9]